MATIRKGEDKTLTVTLNTDGLPRDVTGSTVTAQLASKKKDREANGDLITCSSGATGADFSAGIIKVIYTDTQTDALTTGNYVLELEETDSGGLIHKFEAGEEVCVIDSVI